MAMSALRIWLVLLAALVFHLLLARYAARGLLYVDPLTVVVLYISVSRSPVAGMLAGSVAGLMMDAFSAQLLGVSSFGKTLAAYAMGELSIKLDVRSPFFLAPLIFVISCMETGSSVLLDRIVGLTPILPLKAIPIISLGNSVLGTAIIRGTERLRPRKHYR